MRFSTSGLRGLVRLRALARPLTAAAEPQAPLTLGRIGAPRVRRDLGRRDTALSYNRVIVPSLLIDHTELLLRQHGVCGDEGFGIWAGTLAGGDAFVSTLIIPKIDGGGFHGEVSAETAATLFDELDLLDLVPIAQIHSHPSEAFLSPIDAERPLVAAPGFLSVIIPSFGFNDLADVDVWRAYEFHGRNVWRELDEAERRRRLIVDPSLLRID
jgi:hypothetical protein